MEKQLLEEALKGLDRLVKAGRFYPAGHPALASATDEALAAFRALVADRENFVFTVRREAILFDDQPLSAENPAVKKLATLFFSRRINRLMIQADVKAEDILAFVNALALDPATIQAQGGIQEVLYQGRVTTIWTNEIDMDQILAKREELTQEGEADEAADEIKDGPDPVLEPGQEEPGEEFSSSADVVEGDASTDTDAVEAQSQPVKEHTLTDVLSALRQAQDDERYCTLLRELPDAVRENLTAEHRDAIFQALALVCRAVGETKDGEVRQQTAQGVLDDLCADDLFDYLIDIVCDKNLPEKVHDYTRKIIVFLKERIGGRVMHRLVEAEDAAARRILTTLLTRFGKTALPIALEYLHDEQWYVVRNAIIVLADLRLQDAVPKLALSLNHDDMRVRRETVRALTKIGGDRSVDILTSVLRSDDDDLRRQALLSLGAMRNATAVPSLLGLLEDVGTMLKQFELSKDAIRALGEIGSHDAVSHLIEIVVAKRFWKRGQLDELRAAAINALGEIGGDDARLTVESAVDDRSQSVVSAARHALKTLNKNSGR